MRAKALLAGAACVLVVLAGCGGSGSGVGGDLSPAPPQVETGEVTVGPFVMRTAAASNMKVHNLPNDSGAAFAVFSGATIDYIGVRELLDRVVFTSWRSFSKFDLYTCDFFGDNQERITFNGRNNYHPRWSPDGTQMAWTYETATMQGEILVRPAEGGAATTLTNNAADDEHCTWSPDGRWIAFETNREGDRDIYKMLVDGSNQRAVTEDGTTGPNDCEPDWGPHSQRIIFDSFRSSHELYTIDPDGTNEQKVTNNTRSDGYPAWHPDGIHFAFEQFGPGSLSLEIMVSDVNTKNEQTFASSDEGDRDPCYSTDGRYLFFASERTSNKDIWAKQTTFPYRLHRITNVAGTDKEPHLGSPTFQISRVLVGPNGSDHGYDPVHDAAIADVVAFDREGYLNFVRLGVPPASASSLRVTPLDDTGDELVGVVLSAPNIYYVEEDAGIGVAPHMCDFSGATSNSAALYLDAQTGKLVTVVDLGDSVHTADAGAAAAITHTTSGSSTIARGEFKRVWAADGTLLADGAVGAIEIDAANRLVRAF